MLRDHSADKILSVRDNQEQTTEGAAKVLVLSKVLERIRLGCRMGDQGSVSVVVTKGGAS